MGNKEFHFTNTTKLFARNKIKEDVFLTEKLFDLIKQSNIQTTKDFNTLLTYLYKICDEHLEFKKKPKMKPRQIRKILAIIYLSWEKLVEKLRSENFLITNMISEASYQKALELEAINKK